MTNTAARATVSVGIIAALAGLLAYLFLGEEGKARRESARDWLEDTKEKATKKLAEAQDAMKGDRHFEIKSGRKRISVGYETE